MTEVPPHSRSAGFVLGFIGVAIFSLTLPFTRVAVKELDPVFLAAGRTVLAGVCAAGILVFTRQRWPERADLLRLVVVAAGVVFGFPLLSAIAMQTAPASHGGVVLGLLPLATAFMSLIFAGERPSAMFWLWSVLGSALVIVFALWGGGAELYGADLLLILAVIAAAMGYAAGGALSRRLGGWQVICWALVISMPLTVPLTAWQALKIVEPVSLQSWGCFLYLALMSQLVGFFAWNKGLALGGVAQVGQVQLLQTFMTLGASAVLLGEELTSVTLIFAVLVAACVWLGRMAYVSRR
jgi:drug/metabolite transporter (DMT)-like permease